MKTKKTVKAVKAEKRVCPNCGSQNTYSNPKENGKHLYCNHCGHEEFND